MDDVHFRSTIHGMRMRMGAGVDHVLQLYVMMRLGLLVYRLLDIILRDEFEKVRS